MDLEKLRIPDIWYDAYVKLLPGCIFLGGYAWRFNWSAEKWFDLLFVGVAAFCIGMFTQPIAAAIAKWIEMDKDGKVRKVSRDLERRGFFRRSLLLSKMHAEVSFFCQIAVLGLVLIVLSILFKDNEIDRVKDGTFVLLTALSIPIAYLVGKRRRNRAIMEEADTKGMISKNISSD